MQHSDNYEEVENQRVTSVVTRILVANSVALIAITLTQFWVADTHVLQYLGMLVVLILNLAGLRLVKAGYARAAATVLTVLVYFGATSSMLLDTTPILFGSVYILAIIVAGMAVSVRFTGILGGLAVALVLGSNTLRSLGFLTDAPPS